MKKKEVIILIQIFYKELSKKEKNKLCKILII